MCLIVYRLAGNPVSNLAASRLAEMVGRGADRRRPGLSVPSDTLRVPNMPVGMSDSRRSGVFPLNESNQF